VSNYKWIIEIPITDGVLEFFADRAYISNPKEGSKPAAFANNPNAKFEGQADPRRNRDGIANVVLKKSGFAFFWEQVGQLRFYEDSKHISQNNSLDPEALREERIARKKEEGKEARAVRENMASENIENGDIIFDYELFVDNDY
jgi:hypothetical protein